ncbi:MAG TPA: ABC transporter permease [Thermoanaerobaculia bacterium]
MSSVDVAWEICRRTWTKTARRPMLLTFSFAQPLMWMVFFGFLFHRYSLSGLGGAVSYLDFLTPGVCAMTVLFGASQSGIGWIRDLQTGFLPRMLNTPASHHALLLGKILADVLRLLAQALVVLLLALALGARLTPAWGAVLPAALCLALFAAAFSSLSCALALRTRAQEAMAAFVHLVNLPILFTSTALVPVRHMPAWLAAAARWNPLTLTVDAWRGALLFGDMPSAAGQLLPLAILAAVFYLMAAREMRGIAALY